MRLKVFLWPRPAAAAGAPGMPGFTLCAVPPDEDGQAEGAVPGRHEKRGGGAHGPEITV